MTVNELVNNVIKNEDYFPNSLVLKSSDKYGCVYKWLIRGKVATRKEIFIALDEQEENLDLLDKTVIEYIEVYPAE